MPLGAEYPQLHGLVAGIKPSHRTPNRGRDAETLADAARNRKVA